MQNTPKEQIGKQARNRQRKQKQQTKHYNQQNTSQAKAKLEKDGHSQQPTRK